MNSNKSWKTQVEDLLDEGYSEEQIASQLGLSQEVIAGIIELIESYDGDDAGDGQPDEAQEWHDYDPDC